MCVPITQVDRWMKVLKSTSAFNNQSNRKDDLDGQYSNKLLWIKLADFWSPTLDGDVNFAGETEINSETQIQTQFKSFCENPIFSPTQCCTENVTSTVVLKRR